jgi:hypothetical protein
MGAIFNFNLLRKAFRYGRHRGIIVHLYYKGIKIYVVHFPSFSMGEVQTSGQLLQGISGTKILRTADRLNYLKDIIQCQNFSQLEIRSSGSNGIPNADTYRSTTKDELHDLVRSTWHFLLTATFWQETAIQSVRGEILCSAVMFKIKKMY